MAMILDAFVEACIDKLLKVAEEETTMLLGVVDDELKKLQIRMKRIQAFLKSAEKKRYIDPVINSLVMELKDVMYDVDDIIDLCMIKGRRLLEDHPSESADLPQGPPQLALRYTKDPPSFETNVVESEESVD
uniref:Probable disease resistance RPP8-like protein 2 isoform X2 n=1 Tax=Elaeis guineensis var. tenera TaxID=51953 RepID=A0A8N4F3N9_ELAGV|nr:probable disease resistance RPP8-like protein 2 isoform X2 [Elaeis guineensis]